MKAKLLITCCLSLLMSIAIRAQVYPFKAENGKYGFKDKAGNIVTTPRYEYVTVLTENSDSIYGVSINKKYAFLSGMTGKQLTPLVYDDVDFFGGDFAMIRRGGVCGFINKEGKEVVLPKYDDVGGAHDGIAWFRKGGVLNEKGVAVGGKYGYVDIATGKEIVSAIYDDAHSFEQGKAKVKKGDREFYIDKTGKEIK